MTTPMTARRGRRGWLIAALAVTSSVLVGSVVAVGAWGIGPSSGGTRACSAFDGGRSDHDGPMMGRDARSGSAPGRRSDRMGTMDRWGPG